MTNEEYARRVIALKKRIDARFPWPDVDYDYDKWPWKVAAHGRERAYARILGLPRYWNRKR